MGSLIGSGTRGLGSQFGRCLRICSRWIPCMPSPSSHGSRAPTQASLHRVIWDAWNDGLGVAATSRKGDWARLVVRFHLGHRGQLSAGPVGGSRAAPTRGSQGLAPCGHLGDGISRVKVGLQSHAGRSNGCGSWEDRHVWRGGLSDPRRQNEGSGMRGLPSLGQRSRTRRRQQLSTGPLG